MSSMYSEKYYRIQEEYLNLKNQYSDLDLPVKYFQKPENLEVDKKGSKIIEFYQKKCVFITGGTGFLGKLLVEKLLRACTDIDTIYLLIRSKKGKCMETRLQEIFNDPVYAPLKNLQPKFLQKIVGINGDITLSGLGISPEDRKTLVDRVNLIFHVAATVKFNEKIRLAYKTNVMGTQSIVALAKECQNLKSYVHISTAYSNCIQEDVDEIFYEPPVELNKLEEMLDKFSDEELEEMTPKILGKYPNSYTYTKNLAEHFVKENMNNSPASVVRPSIVISTYQEPVKGWIDNFLGPIGMAAATGTGLLHSIWCDGSKLLDIVPADYVINCTIAVGYQTSLEKSIKIYNYTTGAENPIKFSKFVNGMLAMGTKVPSSHIMGPMHLTMHKHKLIHNIYIFILHLLPGFIIDCGMVLTGKKIRIVNVYKKIHAYMEVIEFFTKAEWNFINTNTQELWNNLSAPDKNAFSFSMKELDWNIYYTTAVTGGMICLLKEDLSNMDKSRSRKKIVNYVYYGFVYTLLFFFLRFIHGILTTLFT